MIKILSFCLMGLFFLASCSPSSVKDNVQHGINKGGEIVGQTAGEFASGVGNGVEKAFEIKLQLSDELTARGVRLGKVILSNDSAGTDNVLNVYVIFGQDFKGVLTAKAFDDNGLEMGRSKLPVDAKRDDAQFFEFHFDAKTNIDHNSKITVQ